ncbi:MAG: TolC family protein [Bacteroidota bacterium]|nr:TolC family protein [Bacteroidota bacterium]
MAQPVYSLAQCKKMALENNAQIKNSNLEIKASEQIKKATYTKYFPTASATLMSFRTTDPLITAKIPAANLPVYDGNLANLASAKQFAYFPGMNISALDKSTLGGISIVQPLFAGGRIVSGNKLATIGIDISNRKAVLSKNEVLLRTEEQYWLVVSLHEKEKTLNAYSELLDTLYKQANDAYHAGLINRNEVLKVTLKQNEIRMNKLKLENGIKLATMALCQYIGTSYDPRMAFTDKISKCKSPDEVYQKAEQALTNRQEYAMLQKGIEAEKLQTRIKKGEYMPEVGVGVGEIYQNITDNNKFNTMAFVSVKVPISGWWEATHSLKERQIREQIAQNNCQDNTELLTLQMQKGWNELEESYKQIQVAEDAIKQAEENLKINNDNYKAGMINISDMLESQALLQQTKDQLIDVQTTYAVKLVNYLQVTGRYQ